MKKKVQLKFDLSRNRIVSRVDKIIPAGVLPLSEVSDNIRSLLLNDKKAEKIISDLDSKNLSTLEEYAAAMDSKIDSVKFVDFNTSNITNLGNEPVLNAYAAYAHNTIVGPLRQYGCVCYDVINRE